jgi:archaellum component FlaG (FlaF/FlaG flagellin family)
MASSMKEVIKIYILLIIKLGNAFILKDPSQVNSQAEKDYLMFIKNAGHRNSPYVSLLTRS